MEYVQESFFWHSVLQDRFGSQLNQSRRVIQMHETQNWQNDLKEFQYGISGDKHDIG
jgi:hypothetical protein